MNTTTYKAPTTTAVDIPDQMGDLPIFSLMKNNLQNISHDAASKVQTPEGKKTVSKVIYGIIFAAVVYGLYAHYTDITAFMNGLFSIAWDAVWLTVPLGILVLLYLMRHIIIGWMHHFGTYIGDVVNTEIFKKEKGYVQSNAIATLNMKALEADKSVDAAEKSVTDVEAAKNNALGEAQRNKNEAQEKMSYLSQCNNAIQNEILPKLNDAKAAKDSAKISTWSRKLDDMTANAAIAKSEYVAAMDSQRTYAQFANQIDKMIEILRDNASSARIMAKALRSSIHIIEKKLETTTNINRATQNISAAFQIKDGWKFDVAMNAVNMAIDQNIAQIKTNIRFANQSRGTISGAISADDLNNFVQGMKNVKPLNLIEIGSAAHELTPDEIVDPTFNIL